jgi:hypothetical protein
MAMAVRKLEEEPIILTGGDPEFFVHHGGVIVSSRGILGGSKNDPRKLEHGSVQEDNIMLEINLKPASTLQEFNGNISRLLDEVRNHLSINNLALMVQAPEILMDNELKQLHEAQEFGCEPDYNAWTGKRNKTPKLEREEWRFAGGHIHTSVNRVLAKLEQRNIVKWYDASVGLYCVIHDTGLRRASVYGTAGRFRYTEYDEGITGIEYRVPSNFWVSSKAHSSNIFLLSQWAMKKGLKNDFHDDTVGIEGIELMVQEAINNRDKELARFLYGRMMAIHAIGQ